MRSVAAAKIEPHRPAHIVGYVVGSGPGYVREPRTLEMVSDALVAFRFPTLADAERIVGLMEENGFEARIVQLVKNGPGPQVPYSTLSAEPSEAETDAGPWIERYAELLRCEPRPGAVAAAIERLQHDLAAAARPETV